MDGVTVADQARVQAQVLCDDFIDFNKGPFVSCIEYMHEGFYNLIGLLSFLVTRFRFQKWPSVQFLGF